YRSWTDAGGAVADALPERVDWGLVVDGLFGIGLRRAIEGVPAQWIERVNASDVPILALDIPSGLNADTGVAMQPAIRAKATATFLALKPGLLTGDGPDHCGVVSVHSLDIDVETLSQAHGQCLTWHSVRVMLPTTLRRARRNVHKGSFGTLGIIGGNEGMVGAATLAGRAALHLGAGKIWIGFV